MDAAHSSKTYLPETFSVFITGGLLFSDEGDITGDQNIGLLPQIDVTSCPEKFYCIKQHVENILFPLRHVMRPGKQEFS
jgi:hypothetical protein